MSSADAAIGVQPWMSEPAAMAVMDALEAARPGGARFVGGAVRNALMGQPIDDVDISTVLTPEAVVAALAAAGLKSIPTGIEFGTVTAIADGKPFEITSLRRDVETDGRRAVVAFTDDWREDAERRDFRFNALYADRTGKVFDPVGGGVEDARAGRVVFVGDPAQRLAEDHLRILRFFRFHAWYGKADPDPAGLAACAAAKDRIEALSSERIGKEMLKLLAAADPRAAVRLMIETGVMGEVLTGALNPGRFQAMVDLDGDPILRLAALLEDANAAKAASARLRLSNAQRDRLLAAVIADEALAPDMPLADARAALYRRGWQMVRDRLLLQFAAGAASPLPLLSSLQGWTRPVLPVGGADAIASGVAKGPGVGEALGRAENAWIDSDFTLGREALLALLKKI